MRYYSLTISDATTGAVYVPSMDGGFAKVGGVAPLKIPGILGTPVQALTIPLRGVTPQGIAPSATFTTMPNGKHDPNALQLDLDVPVAPFNRPEGNALIAIAGVGLRMLSQAFSLANANVSLRAGMSAGLPLAKPAQAGEIVQGRIYQAYGNWQGTNQVLTLIVQAAPVQQNEIVWIWRKGTSLAESITTAIKGSFPGYTVDVRISPVVITTTDRVSHYPDIISFAEQLALTTGKLGTRALGQQYGGVQLIRRGSIITAFDGTQSPRTVQLAFEDLIGQPTWIDPQTVQFRTVLRADITVGDNIKFPAGIAAPYALTSPQAAAPHAPVSSRIAFGGTFRILNVHHFGSSRQPQGNAWNTTFRAGSLINTGA